MNGFIKIILKDLIEQAKENPETITFSEVEDIVSGFYCPFNNDVQLFLREKAIIFEKQRISATHLIFTSYKEEWVLVGYFTLAAKYIHIKSNGKGSLSKTLRKRINKFGTYDREIKKHIIPAVLIGQIGKNYQHGYNKLITGSELLKIACDTIQESQAIVGGKTIYLECEDIPQLVPFYEKNGFVSFGRRNLEEKEGRIYKGEYLLQMLKYLS